MGNPVTITVNAETAQAAAAMQSLGTTGKESLKQLREGALLTREGFHSLESTVLLLGGTRFPMLAEGIIGIRSAMMGARTASMITGVSLATIIPIIGGIAAAVGAGALAWGAIKSEQDRARESANQLAEAYKQMPELIGRINDAHRAGVISAADQQRMLTTLGVARPSSQNAFNAAVMLPGQQSGAGNAQPPLRLSTSQMGIPDHNDIRLTN